MGRILGAPNIDVKSKACKQTGEKAASPEFREPAGSHSQDSWVRYLWQGG
jgi:hypothetical protein